jgi:hypothetical protein
MPGSKKITVNVVTWKSEKGGVVPLIIILSSIIIVFAISRLLTYLIVVAAVLPSSLFLNIGDFRLHHFVYGNIIIVLTSFLAIGLGITKHRNLFALFYGIGLGLILDEFLLWIGDTEALTQITLWIPHSSTVIAAVCILIATLIMIDLYKIRLINRRVTLKQKK